MGRKNRGEYLEIKKYLKTLKKRRQCEKHSLLQWLRDLKTSVKKHEMPG